MIDLARSLDMTVVAEGTEAAEELVSLLALDREMGQGYFFARPMPADDIPAWCVGACAPGARVA